MRKELTIEITHEAESLLEEGAKQAGVSVSELVRNIINAWAIFQIMMQKDD